MIVRVNVVLNRTVVDSNSCFDNLCGSHRQNQSELYHVSLWYYTLVIDLIGQLCRDVSAVGKKLSFQSIQKNGSIKRFVVKITPVKSSYVSLSLTSLNF